MRHETERINLAAIEMDRGDQPIRVSLDVKHDRIPTAAHLDGIRMRKLPPDIFNARPFRPFNTRQPRLQGLSSIRMLVGKPPYCPPGNHMHVRITICYMQDKMSRRI
jgi:hypothetical protein